MFNIFLHLFNARKVEKNLSAKNEQYNQIGALLLLFIIFAIIMIAFQFC